MLANVLSYTLSKFISNDNKYALKPRRSVVRRYALIATPLAVLAIWHFITALGFFPAFIIPSPEAVGTKLVTVIQDGRLWLHMGVTLQEVLGGLFLGVSIGMILGYLIAHIPVLEDLLSPIIVAFQATPILAYAPLLVIWFGTGITGKMITGALVVFFPMLMNTIVGIRGVPENLRDLMHVSRASRWQLFAKLELPAAMPVLLTGLKTSATLAVIGAVVGEFVTANAGLGYWVKVARDSYDTPLVFVAVISLTVIALSLYGAVSLLERRLLAWQRRHRIVV